MTADGLRGCVLPTGEVGVETLCRGQHEGGPGGVRVGPTVVGGNGLQGPAFYPLKVEDLPYKKKMNPCGVVPDCFANTSYQNDFMYRGKDNRRCRNLQFETEKETCVINFCSDASKKTGFGRVTTDLKPVVIKPVIDEIPEGISEYMAAISRTGDRIIKWNIHNKSTQRHK